MYYYSLKLKTRQKSSKRFWKSNQMMIAQKKLKRMSCLLQKARVKKGFRFLIAKTKAY